MNSGGDTGGWSPRRLTLIAVLSFCGGLLLVLLAASAGPVPTVALLAALGVGWAWLSRSRRAAIAEPEPRPSVPPAPSTPRAPSPPPAPAPTRPAAPPNPVRPVPPGPDLEVATIVQSETALATMLERKLPCWRYAAFVSVLVQRRTAVGRRLRDARMGFAEPGGEVLPTEAEAGLFFTDRLAELHDIIAGVDFFLLSPAFQEAFGTDEDSADADAILGAARRLMDYHDRALALCERCRGVEVPPSCRDLQRDMGILTSLPLEGVRRFIADMTDRVDEAADVARFATGDIQLDPVELSVSDDDGILEKVSARLQQIARGA